MEISRPADFFAEVAFPWVIGIEKGFQNDPDDKGNWTGGAVGAGVLKGTKYGVSAAAYPDLNIENLTLADAQAIARRDYWAKVGGDQIHSGVALCVFDYAYNHGTHGAVQCLQRVVGTTPDGGMGPLTVAACNAYGTALAADYTNARLAEYKAMSGWPKYGAGWEARAKNTFLKARSCGQL